VNKKPAPKPVSIDQAVLAAQRMALAAQFLLGELLIDVARLHPSPERYLGELFERVARRADPRDLKIPEKAVYGHARDLLEDLFAGASKRFRNTPGRGQT
jgi:hypothetical protein